MCVCDVLCCAVLCVCCACAPLLVSSPVLREENEKLRKLLEGKVDLNAALSGEGKEES